MNLSTQKKYKTTIAVVLLFFVAICGLQAQDTDCNVSDAERQALIDFYNQMGGQNWSRSDNWLTETPVCDWFGVTVENSTVTEIILINNNITGEIPGTVLLGLPNLSSFQLSRNPGVTGLIPTELSQLTKLRVLGLDRNSLSGTIPSELGNLSDLEFLNLDTNSISGTIPIALGQLSKLRELNLFRNQLTGDIPVGLGNLSELQFLRLFDNQLTGVIPPELGNLTKLRNLTLSGNQLTGTIPEALGQLKDLEALILFNNQLTGTIPESFLGMDTINALNLQSNQLSGRVPAGLELMPELELFYIRNNSFVFNDFETEHLDYISNITNYLYQPQSKVDQVETLSVEENSSITLTSVALTSPNNSYQWYKDDIAIAGATNKDLVISNAKTTDAGVYHFTATNSIITDLTLERNPITLVVTEGTDSINPAFLTDCETCYSFKPEPGRYAVDAWVKETGEFSNAEPLSTLQNYTKSAIDILITDRNNEVITTRIVPSGNIIEGWQRVVGVFEIPEDAIYFEIELKNNRLTTDELVQQIFTPVPDITNNGIFTGYEFEDLDINFTCNPGTTVFFNLLNNESIEAGKIYRIVSRGGPRYYKAISKLSPGETYPDNPNNSLLGVRHESNLTCEELSNRVSENLKSQFSFFDDVRIYPYDANMKSFVYDYDTQRLVSELDENNFATFYEYDQEGGLIRVKKETERGIYTIQETRSHSPKRILNEILYEAPNSGGGEGENEGGGGEGEG